MLRFSLYQVFPNSRVYPSFDGEPEPRRSLLSGFLMDFYGQEALCLADIAKAEAGETILDLYNNLIDVQLYPDGRVILEELRYNAEDEAERGPPARTELTLAETKQLILDYLAAKKEWRAQQAATDVAPATNPAAGSVAPDTTAQLPINTKAPP